MRALLQRVTRAEVRAGGAPVGRIGPGLLILVGVAPGDTERTASELADKVANLRIFRDPGGRTNLSLRDVRGEALVVSQFTLFADTRRGRRPGFTGAAPPEQAERLYVRFAELLGATATGSFGDEMEVELVNDGPMTIWLDTEAG
jgi:D-tyrosyl-tRNA(Tyr) deacylase